MLPPRISQITDSPYFHPHSTPTPRIARSSSLRPRNTGDPELTDLGPRTVEVNIRDPALARSAPLPRVARLNSAARAADATRT